MHPSIMNAFLGSLVIVFLCIEAIAVSAESCGSGSTSSGRQLRIKGADVVLRSAPNAKGERLINQKATQILKAKQYLTIDHTVTVIEECTQGEWARVRVKEPEWLRDTHVGWVQSRSLRVQKKDGSGFGEFIEEDFIWDKKTSPHKKIIIAGVNKVHRENPRCKVIDTGTAYIAFGRGSPSDPVFFVTCGSGTDVFNAFFSKSEVERGITLVAVKHIDRRHAIDLCEAYSKSKARHPNTVSFSHILDLEVNEHPNGRTTVISTFTGKNSFNLEIKHSIRCLLDASGLIEAHISEAN